MNSQTQTYPLQINNNYIKKVRIGHPRYTRNKAGSITRIYLPVSHPTLGLFKEISGADRYTLQEKLNELLVSWEKKDRTQQVRDDRAAGKELAEELVTEADQKIVDIESLLNQSIKTTGRVYWDKLRSTETYAPQEFAKRQPLIPPKPKGPELALPTYTPPTVGFFQRLAGKTRSISDEAHTKFTNECEKLREEHAAKLVEYEIVLRKRDEEYAERVAGWKREKDDWDRDQQRQVTQSVEKLNQHNYEIDLLAADWSSGVPTAVLEHASLVLDSSDYPDWFQASYRVDYTEVERLLKVEFMLPTPSITDIPKTARFIASTGEIKTSQIAKAEQKRLYDSLCYQVALRTVYELFEADTPSNISAILFNGVVRHTDPATGLEEDLTIMSALFEREKFLEVNLAAVDPKACFKSFKGVAAASLSGLAAIAPVIQFDTTDKRFIDGREVAVGVDEGMNIAAMSWDDFEHLVREIFEKEFASRGGEVKVTQSSSDGGVDAVAFDPDPITGGKIVIQAKRYTKTVGVAAVRDLYGTVMNEGASKGILVTTADYGPDAYKFAADKPITLLNGSNLLHLLSKHGVNAQIDLKAARQVLGLTN